MKRIGVAIVSACILTVGLIQSPPIFSHETTTTTVLFDREIVGILNRRCVMCHADSSIAFPLVTYEQTWLRRRSIRSAVLRRHMPPWGAVPGYGQFINDNGLTLRETQFIVSWVEGLGARNAGTVFLNVSDPGAAPPQNVRAQTHFDHWQLGQPNLMRRLAPNTVEPHSVDFIKRTVLDLGLSSERRIRALEYMPGDRRVVRAAFFTLQQTGQWLGSWTPWHGFVKLPGGLAYRLPAGSRIVAEIHYRGVKEQVIDEGVLGLYFADEPTTRSPSDLVLEVKGQVPGGAAWQKFRAQTRLVADTHVLALRPEVQSGVKSIEVSARKPDGTTEILLFAKDLPLDWPTPYILREPVRLPRGTQLSVISYHANTAPVSAAGGIRLTVSVARGL